MSQIKCPNCGTVFQVDESQYHEILQQVRNEEFEKELKDIADSDNRQWQDYNYTVEEFDEFYGKISKREDRFLSDRAFMQKIDVDKLLQLIPLLETSQISKLRLSLIHI